MTQALKIEHFHEFLKSFEYSKLSYSPEKKNLFKNFCESFFKILYYTKPSQEVLQDLYKTYCRQLVHNLDNEIRNLNGIVLSAFVNSEFKQVPNFVISELILLLEKEPNFEIKKTILEFFGNSGIFFLFHFSFFYLLLFFFPYYHSFLSCSIFRVVFKLLIFKAAWLFFSFLSFVIVLSNSLFSYDTQGNIVESNELCSILTVLVEFLMLDDKQLFNVSYQQIRTISTLKGLLD